MTEQNQPNITRRNLMITAGTVTGTGTGVVAGGSSLIEPAAGQSLSGVVEVNVKDGRGINMQGKPERLAISPDSEIVLTDLVARNKVPSMVKVQATVKDNASIDWDVIGKAGFIIESSDETIPVSELDERSLLAHKDIENDVLNIFNQPGVDDMTDLYDKKKRYIQETFLIRVVVETLDGGTVISEDDAKVTKTNISFGMQYGIGNGLGQNLGRVAPEYDSGIRWDLTPQVPESEAPDTEPYNNS